MAVAFYNTVTDSNNNAHYAQLIRRDADFTPRSASGALPTRLVLVYRVCASPAQFSPSFFFHFAFCWACSIQHCAYRKSTAYVSVTVDPSGHFFPPFLPEVGLAVLA